MTVNAITDTKKGRTGIAPTYLSNYYITVSGWRTKMATDFYRAMLCISAAYAIMRCLSVRPSVCVSVTFVDHVKTNKHVVEILSPSGSHTILVFSYQTGWWYFGRNPLRGVSNAGAVGRNCDSESISGFSACCERCSKPGVVNRVAGGARPAYR